MSYARYAAAAADVEALSGGARLQWKLRQAQAELRAALPFLGDDIFVLIAAELDAHMLGRLACTAPRFWRASVPDPTHKGRAPAEPPLPFLGDDIFVLIAAELDARMLGRLGCAAQRFWRPSVPDPAHTAEDAGGL